MKWAVREANRSYVEQTLQEDEPGDVFQVDLHSLLLLLLLFQFSSVRQG